MAAAQATAIGRCLLAGIFALGPGGVAGADAVAPVPAPMADGQTRVYRVIADVSLTEAETPGQGNGAVEPGEFVRLAIALRNAGPEEMRAVSLTLRVVGQPPPAFVRLIVPAHTYGNLAAGAAAGGVAGWTHALEVDAAAPAPTSVLLEGTLASGGRALGEPFQFELPVHAPPPLPLQVTLPGPLAPGEPRAIRVALAPNPPAELEDLEVIPVPIDFDVRVSPACLDELEEAGAGELLCRTEGFPARSRSRLTLAVSALVHGVPYQWNLPIELPLRPRGGATAELALCGLTPGAVRLERFGEPVRPPAGTGSGAEFAAVLPVPAGDYTLRRRAAGTGQVPALVVRQGERLLEAEARFAPGAGPLVFEWAAPAPGGSVWLRVREDTLWVEPALLPGGMVAIPAGTFARGRSDAQAQNAFPARSLRLAAFGIDAFEVTRAEYGKFLASGEARTHRGCPPGEPRGKDHTPADWDQAPAVGAAGEAGDLPVVGVDWFDACAYAAWAGNRLPTEAEWERAAAGPVAARYPWGDDRDFVNLANVDRLRAGPLPVGRCFRDRTAEGGYDFGGNVAEWCADGYAADYYARAPEQDPQGPQDGTERVVRGGSWDGYSPDARCTARSHADPLFRSPALGFRCARSLDRP